VFLFWHMNLHYMNIVFAAPGNGLSCGDWLKASAAIGLGERSVDARAAGRMVLVRSHAERIVVLLGDEAVADHKQSALQGTHIRERALRSR